jgi:hypothetical protein
MDQLGTSHITTADFVVFGVAILLIWKLNSPPRNTVLSRAVALLSGCAVVAAVAILLFADDLNNNAVMELAMLAVNLCLSLLTWNSKRNSVKASLDGEH